jgi:hypothetical protein
MTCLKSPRVFQGVFKGAKTKKRQMATAKAMAMDWLMGDDVSSPARLYKNAAS